MSINATEKYTVIVVDDDPAIQLLVIECLEQEKDFRVFTCLDGESALKKLSKVKADIILLDINMPGISGIETCIQIRQQFYYQQLPILMMTGMDDIKSIDQSYEAGATDFITKPVNWPLLVHHIRYILRASMTLVENDYYMQLQALNLNLSGLTHKHFDSVGNLLIEAIKIIKSYSICFDKEIQIVLDQTQADQHGLKSIPSNENNLCLQSPSAILATKSQYTKQSTLCFPLRLSGKEIGILSINSSIQNFSTPFFRSVSDTISQLIEQVRDRLELQFAANYFDHSLEGILIIDRQGKIMRINQAFTKITGYEAHEVIGKSYTLLRSIKHNQAFYQTIWNSLNQNGSWQGEIWKKHKTGRVFPEWISIVKIEQQNTTLYMGVFVDISRQKQQDQNIERLAYYDSLTGIANRTLFYDHLELAVKQARHQDKGLALILIDLDRFKLVNDSLGIKYGDQLLIHVASQLKSLAINGHSIARLNSDEFILLITNLKSDYQHAKKIAIDFAKQIKKDLSRPQRLGNKELSITCSIGVCIFPNDSQQPKELIKHVNIAMQKSKNNGGDSYTCYEQAMLNQGIQRFNIEHALQGAIRNQELEIYYQPQVNQQGIVIGAECLLRWRTDNHGWITPIEFIPIAEETGLIKELGSWVLTSACKKIVEWQNNGYMDENGLAYLAVNISPRQLNDNQFIEELDEIIKKSGLTDLSKLELELTESCLITNPQSTVNIVNQLHNMGIRLSIDDFGTGYSSLSYLKDFELDTLKIDQSFVKECLENDKTAAIIRTIISMSKNLQLSIIAEGIETQSQWQFLKDNDCHCFQGYFFSKPLPVKEFERYLRIKNQIDIKY